MGRRSRQAQVEKLIEKLRNKIDGLSIRTSLIVGFPGETDEDYEILKKFIRDYRLDKVGIFTYSREEGTPAYDYDNQIDEETKENRRNELMAIQQDISNSLNSAKKGTTASVIIEGYDEAEFCYVGRCSTDTPEVDGAAYVYSEEELSAGDIINAEIIDSSEYDVVCRYVETLYNK